MMRSRLYNSLIKIKTILMVLIFILLSSCGSTKISTNPSYGFRFKGNENIVGWIILDGEINNYWTGELASYLSEHQLNVAGHADIQEIIYTHLLSKKLTDSISLIRLRELTGLDYLLIGSFYWFFWREKQIFWQRL